jgi:hypothetical protein
MAENISNSDTPRPSVPPRPAADHTPAIHVAEQAAARAEKKAAAETTANDSGRMDALKDRLSGAVEGATKAVQKAAAHPRETLQTLAEAGRPYADAALGAPGASDVVAQNSKEAAKKFEEGAKKGVVILAATATMAHGVGGLDGHQDNKTVAGSHHVVASNHDMAQNSPRGASHPESLQKGGALPTGVDSAPAVAKSGPPVKDTTSAADKVAEGIRDVGGKIYDSAEDAAARKKDEQDAANAANREQRRQS